jgi:5'/3'-nucleotidase SurE
MAGQTSHDKVRFATFNASLNRNNAGELITDLSTPDNEQAKVVAEIIQRTNPDVLLLNEFDYDENGEAIASFKQNYLEVGQNGVDAVDYPYVYLAPSNTGIPSGFDFDNNGSIGGGNDAFGFGNFPGQFGMVLLSKYPIVEEEVRTFQNFLWKDMPGALLPDDGSTPEPNDWYSAEELEVFRLSSKSHWDIPINVNGEVIHVLASHPTPPVFDGEEDRNGKRNHDEIRFWADYVTPGNGEYIYDDSGETGGLNSGAKFVIMGDQNADPNDGDSTDNAILQLLDNPQINTAVTPSSEGGIDAANRQGLNNLTQTGNPAFDTADFNDETSGNLRVDYVLPSNNLDIESAGVFWPESDDSQSDLVESSDHRLVYADVEKTNVDRKTVSNLEFLGEVTFPTGLQLEETEVGGISGLAYDASKGIYYGLSDDRSQRNPARFYDISIDLSDGSLDDGDISFDSITTLLNEDGNAFPQSSLDPEGIVLSKNNTLFISSEGDANNLINPFVNEFSINGQQIAELPVPDKFNPTANQSSGIRNNAAFESLTITPDQRYLYTATENALFQDGSAANVEQESLSRIIKYDLQTGQPVGEFVYEVDEVAEVPDDNNGFRTNGLVELLATDNNGTLLALERSFTAGKGNTVKLYEVQTQGALDVSGVNDLFREEPLEDDGEILAPGAFEIDPAVSKRLLVDFADLGITPDNLEALAFGPTLPDGSQSLIVASDNNFNPTQTTQFLALGLDFDTTPAVLPTVETPYTIDNEEVLEPKPLNILLVNDDGFEAEGIEVMYDALVAAGHNVTFVAPKEQQSGKGTLINVDSLFEPTEVVEFEENKWYVDGSPVVTTLAGLDFVLDGEEPDLVISGINEGENVGASVAISSGTVSAATTATRRNIPAIAVSAGTLRDAAFNVDEAELEKAYEKGADTVVDLVKQLSLYSSASDSKLMPDGVGLNVNIPPVVDNIEGISYTKLDGTGTFNLFVDELAPDVPGLLFTQGEGIEPSEITVEDSEGQNFLADFITVTPIDGDWTASDNVRQTLSDRIESAPENPTATPLNILLTNDDGFDADGIETLYTQLTAAGHNVTLVGPLEQQSGTGTVLDVDKIFQPLDIVNVEGDKWYVDAGVLTTTWAGLDFVLDEQPDLVISGINAGENIGPGGAVSSGTVSAAVTALLRGVPGIAISGGLDLATFETPDTTYDIGADYLVNLIAQLQATQGDDNFILPDGKGLSINIPSRFPDGVTEIQGAVFTNASDTEPFDIDFGLIDENGNVGLRFAPNAIPTEPNPTSEGDQFLSGFITVTPIDGDWTAPQSEREIAENILSAPEPVLAGDSDDPAIWVNPDNSAESIVIGTLKDGGLATFNLQGEVEQVISPEEFGEQRFNNVDIIYNFPLASMMVGADVKVDLAVASDRENDTLAIFSISENGQLNKLATPQLDDAEFSIFGVDDGEATAYGLASYTSPVSRKNYVFVTQADGNKVAQIELTSKLGPADEQLIEAEVVRTLELPTPTGDAEDSQSEGIVIDQELGFLYVALEDQVGILKFSAEPDAGSDFTVVQPVDADYLTPDIEGLSIYYGDNGTGYLIANSQGDSSYAVFSREGNNEYLGSFVVGDNNGIDQVNESDGLDVINLPLGEEFPNGLLVLQDGANDPQNAVEDDEELENNSTNFKFVPWDGVANSFDNSLQINTSSYDPRNPQAQSLINGIASGDTTQNSTVLWARSTFVGEVTFEYSTDAEFNSVIGTVTANVDNINVPVKVEIEGLNPGTEYYYRVTDAAGDSAIGEFETSAEAGTKAGLRFGVAGDWRGEISPYPAISNADESDLAFFVEHGDTIYADYGSAAVLNEDGTFKEQAETLDEYRAKHGEVYGTRFGQNTWADLRASTSILATIDDHEVINDFAGGEPAADDARFPETTGLINDTQLYENGLQSFQEYNPLRDEFYENTGDELTEGERKLYRNNTYGSDAAVITLDNRSFRNQALDNPDATTLGIDLASGVDQTTAFTNFVVNEVLPFETAAFDPTRTMLGQPQLEDLKQDLLKAEQDGTTWKFVMVPEPMQALGPLLGPADRFDGYLNERTEILQFVEDNDIDNVVFIAADIHGTLVNNLTYQEQPGGPQIATNAFEVTTGSVAFDAPFGQSVTNGAAQLGFVTPEQLQQYNSLPILNAPAGVPSKDDFFTQLLNDAALTPFGLDPVGLEADSGIDAELIQGGYVAAHTFGWTEFDINAETQALTVTTYGIEPYSEEELLANPEAITSREPQIVSQFVVNPQEVDPLSATLIDTSNTDADGNEIELIDLTAYAGQTVTASYEINREADYDNNVYFYTVGDEGKIGELAPTDGTEYIQAALNNVVNSSQGLTTPDEQITTGTLEIAGGDMLGVLIVADGNLSEAKNNLDSVEGVYFSYMGANTDNGSFDHIKFENGMFKFEDLVNGGDKDFDDIEIKMEFTV